LSDHALDHNAGLWNAIRKPGISDIMRVRALLQQLLHDRSDIRESLEAHKALIMPPPIPAIQRIPPEIWSQVFAASVDDAWAPGYPRIDVQKPPKLWSSICIPRRIPASAIPLIKIWLQRSGAMPLFIEIQGLSSDFPSAVLDVFVPYSPRWQNLALSLSNVALANLFGKVTPSSLDTLILRMSGRPQQITITKSSATYLRSVGLVISRRIRPDPLILDLPWSQLSHLSMSFLSGSVGDGHDILRECSALTQCSLSATESTWSAATNPLLCLPNLSTLQLTVHWNPGLFLDSLVLPYLTQLEIAFSNHRYEPNIWPKTQIVSLVERSSCQLRSLILRDKNISETDLVECCRSIPSLQHLLVTAGGKKRVPGHTLELLRSRSNPDGRTR